MTLFEINTFSSKEIAPLIVYVVVPLLECQNFIAMGNESGECCDLERVAKAHTTGCCDIENVVVGA